MTNYILCDMSLLQAQRSRGEGELASQGGSFQNLTPSALRATPPTKAEGAF